MTYTIEFTIILLLLILILLRNLSKSINLVVKFKTENNVNNKKYGNISR